MLVYRKDNVQAPSYRGHWIFKYSTMGEPRGTTVRGRQVDDR